MNSCLYCSGHVHNLCASPVDNQCCCSGKPTSLQSSVDIPARRGPEFKTGAESKDPVGTGRARAAKIKPIEAGVTICEWRGLKNAGGGKYPILGCRDGFAESVHHGPDKNTFNNGLDNLSAICTTCHNRWHTKNDPTYSGGRPENGQTWVPEGDYHSLNYDLTKWTEEEKAVDDLEWAVTRELSRHGNKKRYSRLDT